MGNFNNTVFREVSPSEIGWYRIAYIYAGGAARLTASTSNPGASQILDFGFAWMNDAMELKVFNSPGDGDHIHEFCMFKVDNVIHLEINVRVVALLDISADYVIFGGVDGINDIPHFGLRLEKIAGPSGPVLKFADYKVLTVKDAPTPPIVSTFVGDVKSGFQTADHNGWFILNGRAIDTLTAEQQAAATSLGFTTNLPDAIDAVAIQNSGTIGAITGSMSKTLTQENLPAVTLTSDSAGIHYHSVQSCMNDDGKRNFQELYASYAGGQLLWNGGADNSTTNNGTSVMGGRTMDDAGAHTHTIQLGGLDIPINITPRSMCVNMFVFLGVN